jgi:predicted nucleic acid-binding protein
MGSPIRRARKFMTARIFVDTNILVYVYDASHSSKQAVASDRLKMLWQQQCGRTSVQVLNELYVTLTRKLAHALRTEQAWDIVHALMAWEPQPVDRDLLLCAREIEQRYRISWWDSLIVGAAQLQDCTVLLSEDLQAGMSFGPVRVVNPFAAQVQEIAATYAPEPKMPTRHRARGRPKKVTGSVL